MAKVKTYLRVAQNDGGRNRAGDRRGGRERMKPLLLVDIDGVLNCFGGIWTSESDDRWEVPPFQAHGEGAPIRVPKGTGERLARLADGFQMVWGTAWMDRAHSGFEHLWPIGNPCDACDGRGGWDGVYTVTDTGLRKDQCEDCGGSGRISWPFIDFTSASYEEGKSWKLSSVQEYVEDRPFAWIDDDLMPDAFAWARHREEHQGIPSLLVRTRPTFGMTDEHVATLLGFAAHVEAVATQSGQRWATTA